GLLVRPDAELDARPPVRHETEYPAEAFGRRSLRPGTSASWDRVDRAQGNHRARARRLGRLDAAGRAVRAAIAGGRSPHIGPLPTSRLRRPNETPAHVMFLPRKRNEAFAERMAAFGDDVGVSIRCLDGRGHCEAA